MDKITLYKLDSSDRIRVWYCWAGKNEEGLWGVFSQDGLLEGKIKDPVFKESKPKNIGKKNYLNEENQSYKVVDQNKNKKLSKDYYLTIEEAKSNTVFFPAGCPSGMLWSEYKDKSHTKYPALASAKLDGSKMYSTWRYNRVFLNTRSAKEHLNFQHINKALERFYNENPNIVLDGEAYNHLYADKFEDLQSIFRKQDPTPEQRKLSESIAKFYVYDVVDLDKPNLTALERQELMSHLFEIYFEDIDCMVHWPSTIVNSEEEYDEFHENCMDEGFEGSVIKIIDQPYIQRKNKYVMKRKPVYDCEFKVLKVLEGTGTNRGMASTIILDLNEVHGMNEDHISKLSGGVQDAGMAKGWTAKLKEGLLKNHDHIIGEWATFEYGGITKYGKLRFPKFKSTRPNLD